MVIARRDDEWYIEVGSGNHLRAISPHPETKCVRLLNQDSSLGLENPPSITFAPLYNSELVSWDLASDPPLSAITRARHRA